MTVAIQVEFDKEFDALKRYLDALGRRGNFAKAARLASYNLAKHVSRMVERAYRSASYRRTPGTLMSYDMPSPGTHPAGRGVTKDRWSGSSLKRSGTLAGSVRVIRRGSQDWMTTIDPNATYSGKGDPWDAKRGLRVQQVADYMENGRTFTVTVTPAMQAYFRVLNMEREGKLMAAAPRVGTTFMVSIPPKPVWRPVYAAMSKHISEHHRHLHFWLRRKNAHRVPAVSFTGTR